MPEVASAFVSLVPSARGFGRTLERQVGPQVAAAGRTGGKQYGEGMRSSFAGATKDMFRGLAVAAAGVGIAGFFKAAVAGASDLNENATKTQAIFGDGTKAVQEFAKQGGKALGQTQNNVLNAAGTFGTFGKAAGLGGQDLAKFSTDFVGLSTDLASFNNTSPEQAVEAIGAALRGEAEPIRQYGVLLDDATLRNEALRLGLIKNTKTALTPQQKVLAAQAAIYRQTRDAQGDFARTSGGLANQQRILGATLTDLRNNIGAALLPVVLRITKAVSGFVSQMQTGEGAGGRFAAGARAVGDAIKGVVGFVGRYGTAFLALGAAVGVVAAATAAHTLVLALNSGALATWFVQTRIVQAATRAWAAVQWLLNAALSANPIGIVVVALAGLAVGLVVAYKKSETFRNIVQGAWAGIQSAASAAWGFLKGVFAGLQGWVSSVGAAFTSFGQGAAGVWGSFSGAVTSAWSAVTGAVNTAWGVVRGVFAAIAGFLSGPLAVAFGIFRQIAVTVFQVWRAAVVVMWAIVSKVFSAIYTWVRDRLVGAFNFYAAIAKTVWAAVRGAITAAWAVVSPILSAIYTWVRTRLVAAFNFYSGVARTVWGAVHAAITAAWRVVSPVFTTLKRWIDTTLPGAFNTGKTLISSRFNAVRTAITDAWNKHVKPVFTAIGDAIKTTLPKAFDTGVGAIKTAWDKIKGYAKAPVRFVIETVLNRGILAAFNKVSEAVLGKGASKVHINSIPLPAGFADGSEDHRAQIARAGQMRLWAEPETGGEAYIPLSERKRTRSTAILKDVAKRFGYGLTPFANGGTIVKAGKHLKALGYDVAEGPPPFGPVHRVHTANSAHYRGLAIDVNHGAGTSKAEQAALSRIVPYLKGLGLRVIFMAPGHYNHLHAEATGGGSILGNLAGAAGNVLGALDPRKLINRGLDKLGGIPGAGSPFAQAVAGVPRRLAGMLVDKAQDMASSIFGDTRDVGAGTGGFGGAGRWTQLAKVVLNQLGRPGSELGALLRRIQFESGGNPNAINLTDSNARAGHPSRGLMQTIPGTFNAYAGPYRSRGITDPLANIYAGANYAIKRYGSIAAIDPRVRPRGYDQGGWLQPGMTMVENKTGKPEPVLNPQQWAALTRGGGGMTFNAPVFTQSPEEFAREVESRRRLNEALHPTFG